MVFVQTCKISFPESRGREAFFIRRIESAEVETSVKELVDKATVRLPRKLYFALGINDLVKTGDPIVIELGFDGIYNEEFTGYVTKVTPDDVVELACENEAWKLKQRTVNKIVKKATLKKLLETIVPEYEIDAADFQLGDIKMNRTTPLAVLQKLKSEYSIHCFFDGKKLVAGKPYSYRDEEMEYELGRFQLPVNLEYIDENELKVKVRAQSLKSNGTKLEIEVGDEDGAESKLVYSNIGSEADLKKLAESDLERLKRGGYKGDFEHFGIPVVGPGMKVSLSDMFYPERAGRYHVDAVSVRYASSGYFRTIKLGLRI